MTIGDPSDSGGIYNSGTLSVTNSTFMNNVAMYSGGGIYHSYRGKLTVDNNLFLENLAKDGGGIYNSLISLMVTNNTLSGNSATNNGGAIFSYYYLTVINSTFSDNSAEKYGGGIYNDTNSSSKTTLNNTIVAGNSAYTSWPDVKIDSGTLTGAHSLIGDGTGQTILINGVDGNQVGTAGSPIDPRFVDPTGGDYRLSSSLPAIDASDNGLIPSGVITDLDGNYRIIQSHG